MIFGNFVFSSKDFEKMKKVIRKEATAKKHLYFLAEIDLASLERKKNKKEFSDDIRQELLFVSSLFEKYLMSMWEGFHPEKPELPHYNKDLTKS